MSLKQTVENVYLRQDAVQLTRKHFWQLLGMMVLLTSVTFTAERLLSSAGDVVNGAEIQAVLDALRTLNTSSKMTSTAPLMDAIAALLSSPKFWLFNLCYILLTWLLAQGLLLGRYAQEITAARGETPQVMGIFSRMECCVKGVGISLLTGIKVGLRLLPGIIVCGIAAEMEGYGQVAISMLMTMLGVGLLFGLGIPAAFGYMMAPYILADEPDRGVRECVTLSTGLMKYRKWQYFKLCVPMLLKITGVLYAEALILSLLMAAVGENPAPVVSTVVTLVILLAITLPLVYFGLQMDMACALFYLKRKEPEVDAKTSYWLQDHSTPETPAAPPEEPSTKDEKENPNEQSDC